MHLKLRRGVQFSHENGTVQVSLPGILEATTLPLWQYRIMLGLDGEDQFIGVVKNVTDRHGRDFDAGDIWKLLYWLIEKDLLDDSYRLPSTENERGAFPGFVSAAASRPSSSPWLQVPLQLLVVLTVAAGVVCATLFTAPLLISHWQTRPETGDPIAELNRKAEEIKATRMPQLAVPKEVNVAGAVPASPGLTESRPENAAAQAQSPAPPAVMKLLDYRKEIESCQIRRDAHYLLNDEEGYQREVERIAELAREIGGLTSSLEP